MVSPADKVNIVLLAELLHNRLPEDVGNSSFILSPAWNIIRISPQKVTKQSLVWWILRLLNVVDLRQVDEVRRQATVHTEDSLINDRRNGKIVKHGAKLTPEADGIPALALVIETVQSGDGDALVVPT